MNTYSTYNLQDGIFDGDTIICSERHLEMNIPEGYSCRVGVFDHLSQKIDLETGEVVDYIPPQPSENHQWNAEKKRWLYVETDDDIAVKVRKQRDTLLTSTDWTVIRAAERNEPLEADWSAYREALREIPNQTGFPRSVEWPTLPRT